MAIYQGTKCEMLPLNKHCNNSFSHKVNVRKSEINCLGLKSTTNLNSSKEINLANVKQKIKYKLEKWAHLHASLWGRVNIIKMSILPIVNYLLKMMPITINKTWFKQLHTMISMKKSRCSYLRLSSAQNRGLQLPNFFRM